MAWICAVCGYLHDDAQSPEVCPICGADRRKFALDEQA